MSQIRTIVVSVIALIIIFFFIKTASVIGAPSNIFTLVAGLMVLMILWNVGKKLIRGY